MRVGTSPSCVVQLSGDESPEFVRARRRVGRQDLSHRAGRASARDSDTRCDAYAARCRSSIPRLRARAAARARRSIGRCSRSSRALRPIVVAGGLTPENVGECVRAVRPLRRRRAQRHRNRRAAKTRTRCVRSSRPCGRAMQPDARGYFGDFGGRFVPEVLIDALDELEREMTRRVCRPGVLARVRKRCLRDFVGPAFAALSRGALRRAARRRAASAQTRRSQSHRRAQDQQYRRPSAARAAHGQEAADCRDRRGSARRRDRDRRREVRISGRRLHGRGRRRASGAQRVHHASCSARRCIR